PDNLDNAAEVLKGRFPLHQSMERNFPLSRQFVMSLVTLPPPAVDHPGVLPIEQLQNSRGQRVLDFPIQGRVRQIGEAALALTIAWVELREFWSYGPKGGDVKELKRAPIHAEHIRNNPASGMVVVDEAHDPVCRPAVPIKYMLRHGAKGNKLAGDAEGSSPVMPAGRHNTEFVAEEHVSGRHGEFVSSPEQRLVGRPFDSDNVGPQRPLF